MEVTGGRAEGDQKGVFGAKLTCDSMRAGTKYLPLECVHCSQRTSGEQTGKECGHKSFNQSDLYRFPGFF